MIDAEKWIDFGTNVAIIMAFLFKDSQQAKTMVSMLKSAFEDFRSIMDNKDNKDLQMTTLLTPQKYGKEVKNSPPEANNHYKEVIAAVKELKEEMMVWRTEVNINHERLAKRLDLLEDNA